MKFNLECFLTEGEHICREAGMEEVNRDEIARNDLLRINSHSAAIFYKNIHFSQMATADIYLYCDIPRLLLLMVQCTSLEQWESILGLMLLWLVTLR
jgi:hypothetical protein